MRLSSYLWDLTLPAGREGQNCLKLLLSSWVWGDHHTAPQHTHTDMHAHTHHAAQTLLLENCFRDCRPNTLPKQPDPFQVCISSPPLKFRICLPNCLPVIFTWVFNRHYQTKKLLQKSLNFLCQTFNTFPTLLLHFNKWHHHSSIHHLSQKLKY